MGVTGVHSQFLAISRAVSAECDQDNMSDNEAKGEKTDFFCFGVGFSLRPNTRVQSIVRLAEYP